MNVNELEEWSVFACEALQEFCDEAQVAAGNPDGEDQLQDIRALLVDHARIMAGLPRWQSTFQSEQSDIDALNLDPVQDQKRSKDGE